MYWMVYFATYKSSLLLSNSRKKENKTSKKDNIQTLPMRTPRQQSVYEHPTASSSEGGIIRDEYIHPIVFNQSHANDENPQTDSLYENIPWFVEQ